MCLLCLYTCGMFPLCYYLNRWCIKMGCRKPPLIEFSKGKMAITNQGRMLVWKTEFEQEIIKDGAGGGGLCGCLCKMCMGGDTCDPPAKYDSSTYNRQYLVKDIVQVVYDTARTSGFCCPKALQCCCCVERYYGAIRVHWIHFDYSAPENPLGVKTQSLKWYSSYVKAVRRERHTTRRIFV